MSPHTVLHDYSSHLFLQLLLTGWHLVAPAVTPVRPLQVFIVHVPLPFLYGESKAAAYLYFAGPLVSPAAYSPLPRGPSLIDISKSSNKSARRWQISRGFSLSYSQCNLNWEWSEEHRHTPDHRHVTSLEVSSLRDKLEATLFLNSRGFWSIYDQRGLLRRIPQLSLISYSFDLGIGHFRIFFKLN